MCILCEYKFEDDREYYLTVFHEWKRLRERERQRERGGEGGREVYVYVYLTSEGT